MKTPDSYVHYMATSPEQEQQSIICTTIGHQTIQPHTSYPPVGSHPEGYYFRKGYGRRLPEYQIVHIVEGEGWFESEHVSRRLITRGTTILLFPNEWHFYEPNPKTGWTEYWTGFRGQGAEWLMERMQLTPEHPLIRTKTPVRLMDLFNELITASESELTGYQLLCIGIISHMLGLISFTIHSSITSNQSTVDTIQKAQAIMRQYVGQNVSPEKIAQEIGVGYSWFRQAFKECVGTSPAQYQQMLRMQRAEFLLSNPTLSVADIAYELGFSCPNQFSTFFKQHKEISPLAFRRAIQARI